MKLHELRPAEGATRKRTRVGRGIAGGGGKTAGRGTKGQKSRAGASIPAWFEGGQTPLHIRIPKLRGFRNINRIEFEIVNVGAIAAAVEAGRLVADGKGSKGKSAPITVNADLLKQAGLVKDVRRPLKVLGGGDLGVATFVVADAFTKSAREKIEAAGGTAQLLEMPTKPMAALGVHPAPAEPAEAAEPAVAAEPDKPAKPARAERAARAEPVAAEPVAAAPAETEDTETTEPATAEPKRARASRAKAEPVDEEAASPVDPDLDA